ncbi:MAG: DUF3299 domain-containing protein [Limisphaerales bacterium]
MRNLSQALATFTVVGLISIGTLETRAQSEATGEVKGKPIRGEPIRRPARTNSSPEISVSSETKVETPKPAPARGPKMIGDFLEVSFDRLAGYTFEVPEGLIPSEEAGKSNEQIPADVRALDRKKIALTGFMLPLKVDNGLVSEMLIMRDQSLCCYGAQPRINDWVSVKMAGRGVKSVMDQPVTIFGQIRVGEMLENGYLIGIYQMTGERMDVAKE